MEERKIVESVNSYQKTVLKTCIILLVLAVVSFGVCKICRNLCTEYFWNIDYSDPNYETLRQQGSMCDTIAEITSLISVVSLIADVVLWIFATSGYNIFVIPFNKLLSFTHIIIESLR